MPHDEHVLLLALCGEEPQSEARRAMYDDLAIQRGERAIAATFRDFSERRGFVTSRDWQVARLTDAGRSRLLAERAILLTRTP